MHTFSEFISHNAQYRAYIAEHNSTSQDMSQLRHRAMYIYSIWKNRLTPIDYLHYMIYHINKLYGTQYGIQKINDSIDSLITDISITFKDDEKRGYELASTLFDIACKQYPNISDIKYLNPAQCWIHVRTMFNPAIDNVFCCASDCVDNFIEPLTNHLITMYPKCEKLVRMLLRTNDDGVDEYDDVWFVSLNEMLNGEYVKLYLDAISFMSFDNKSFDDTQFDELFDTTSSDDETNSITSIDGDCCCHCSGDSDGGDCISDSHHISDNDSDSDKCCD